ncbi:MAG: DHH family phosphoesterase [Clostridia bacterium]|nr:DHH family phosphoesterase [Clostridia bacterium]
MTDLSFTEVLARLKEPKRTAIVCHKNPDPDCIGSATALSYILIELGSEATVICSERLPKRLSFITKDKEILYSGDFSEFERVICVDVASPSQMGELDKYSHRVDFTIDHHTMNTRFSDYYMEDCAACAQIIFKIGEALNLCNSLPLGFFEAVYAGISGDTGCFKYSNVTNETHIIASKLISKEIDCAEINRLIFDSKTFGEVVAERLTYQHMRLYADGKLSVITFTNKMKKENSLTDEDIGDIVNHIRQIQGVLIAVSIKQSTKDETRFSVSSRSNTDIDVSKLCAIFDGGGHLRAAGCTVIASTAEEAENKIVSVFSKGVTDHGK